MVRHLVASLTALGLAVSVVPVSAASVDADLVLQGGTIHDGSGGEHRDDLRQAAVEPNAVIVDRAGPIDQTTERLHHEKSKF